MNRGNIQPRWCEDCKKMYIDIFDHERNYHKSSKNECPFCDIVFNPRTSQTNHLNSTHKLLCGYHDKPQMTAPAPKLEGETLFETMQQLVKFDENLSIIKKKNFVIVFDQTKRSAVVTFEAKTLSCIEQKIPREDVDYYTYEPFGIHQMHPEGMSGVGYKFDIGHLVPAYNNMLSTQDLRDTCMTPNLSLMHKAINRGVWEVAEGAVHRLLKKGNWGRVLIFSGPILDESKRKRAPGGFRYYIPTYFFKIIIMQREGEESFIQCFKIPNSESYNNLYHYRSTLQEIEALTGLRFSTTLKDLRFTWDLEGFRCTTCSCVFLKKEEFLAHELTHANQFKCGFCPRIFNDEESVTAHRETHKLIPCEICDRKFKSQSGLIEHMKIHTDERPFKCNFKDCKSAFKHKRDLQAHMRGHTGETLFFCPHCTYTTPYHGNLNRHIRTNHGVEPPSKKSRLQLVSNKDQQQDK